MRCGKIAREAIRTCAITREVEQERGAMQVDAVVRLLRFNEAIDMMRNLEHRGLY